MSGVTFTFKLQADSHAALYARLADARLADGSLLSVSAGKSGELVRLGLVGDIGSTYMHFSADQARAVAAELLASADACDAARAQGEKGALVAGRGGQ